MATTLCFRIATGLIVAAGMLACFGDDPVTPLPDCRADPFADVVPADSGWRALVQAQALSVPADTHLVVVAAYRNGVTDADRAELEAAGVTITYEFASIAAVSFDVTARELLTLTEPGGPLFGHRIEYVELGRPVCLAGTHRLQEA